MTRNDFMFAPPPAKPASPDATAHPPEKASATKPTCDPVVLDMGEASREQGFRINGCR
jgi:hypothetical protein